MFVTSLISEVYMIKAEKNENLRDKKDNFKSQEFIEFYLIKYYLEGLCIYITVVVIAKNAL